MQTKKATLIMSIMRQDGYHFLSNSATVLKQELIFLRYCVIRKPKLHQLTPRSGQVVTATGVSCYNLYNSRGDFIKLLFVINNKNVLSFTCKTQYIFVIDNK